MVQMDSSAVKFDSLYRTYFIGWNDWLMEGRKTEYPEKTPNDELQKMPHTKAQKSKPQPRL